MKLFFYKRVIPFLIARLGQACMRLLLRTCSWEVKGLEHFKSLAEKERCILILWHNRLALAPFILYRYAPHFIYSALVSNSRDGELITAVIHSYRTGRTIRVAHHSRHQALKTLIQHLKEKEGIIIITPDGPRGPRYKLKPGIAFAALETEAHVIPLEWTSSKIWQFNTWDQLRFPKPFSKITVSFEPSLQFAKGSSYELNSIQKQLQDSLPK